MLQTVKVGALIVDMEPIMFNQKKIFSLIRRGSLLVATPCTMRTVCKRASRLFGITPAVSNSVLLSIFRSFLRWPRTRAFLLQMRIWQRDDSILSFMMVSSASVEFPGAVNSICYAPRSFGLGAAVFSQDIFGRGQPLSQKSKIFDSSPCTGEPWGRVLGAGEPWVAA